MSRTGALVKVFVRSASPHLALACSCHPLCTEAAHTQCELATCRYIVAETEDTMYLSFVGTKRLQDLLTDLNYWQTHLNEAPGKDGEEGDSRLLVHQGFMARAQTIPIEQLYRLALSKNKALRFCGAVTCHTPSHAMQARSLSRRPHPPRMLAGHSLGGAVAALCALRVLTVFEDAAAHVSCTTFACVALGNRAVARAVHRNCLLYTSPSPRD